MLKDNIERRININFIPENKQKNSYISATINIKIAL